MASVKPPGLERSKGLTLAGLQRHFRLNRSMEEIGLALTAHWHDFKVRNEVQGVPPKLVYGVCHKMHDGAEGFDYFTGAPVRGKPVLPEGFVTLTLPPAHYAVFQHREHVSKLYDTYRLIFGVVLPGAGLKPADGPKGVPEYVERYGESFDPATGLGGLEILIPIAD
jgi:AraC family transcriptional regulator